MQDFVALFREGKIFNSCLDDQVDGVLHLAANGVLNLDLTGFLFNRSGDVCVY